MPPLINVELEEIIKNQQSAPNFNNELLIISLDGSITLKHQERVHINAFSLILTLGGTLSININGRDYHITSKAFLDVLDLHAVQNMGWSTDFKGYHVLIAHSFMEETMRGIKRMPIRNFLSRFDNPVAMLSDEEALLLERIILNIKASIQRTEHLFWRDLVKNELRKLFIEVSNIAMQQSKKEDASPFKSRDDIAAQFVIMINRHCAEEHSVGFYAKELCVEAKSLSRILKGISGKTASRWIDEAIMSKAKMLLKDQGPTIQQIVDKLHFSDQSAFGKFFKKHSGVSPMNYRREQLLL